MLRLLALTPLTPLLSLPLPYEELPAWGWLGARDELICVVFGPIGGGSCRRCCLPTCPCLLGWRPAAAITLDRTKHDTFTYCDRQSHPFVGNPIRGRSGGGRCHGLCARVVLCFAFACLPCSPLVPSPSLSHLLSLLQDRFSMPVAFHRRTFWIDLWLSYCTINACDMRASRESVTEKSSSHLRLFSRTCAPGRSAIIIITSRPSLGDTENLLTRRDHPQAITRSDEQRHPDAGVLAFIACGGSSARGSLDFPTCSRDNGCRLTAAWP